MVEAVGSHEVGVAWAFLPTAPSQSSVPPYLSPPLQMRASVAQDRLCTLAHQLHDLSATHPQHGTDVLGSSCLLNTVLNAAMQLESRYSS